MAAKKNLAYEREQLRRRLDGEEELESKATATNGFIDCDAPIPRRLSSILNPGGGRRRRLTSFARIRGVLPAESDQFRLFRAPNQAGNALCLAVRNAGPMLGVSALEQLAVLGGLPKQWNRLKIVAWSDAYVIDGTDFVPVLARVPRYGWQWSRRVMWNFFDRSYVGIALAG